MDLKQTLFNRHDDYLSKGIYSEEQILKDLNYLRNGEEDKITIPLRVLRCFDNKKFSSFNRYRLIKLKHYSDLRQIADDKKSYTKRFKKNYILVDT